MKLKKIITGISLMSMAGIPLATASLTSCSTLHIHTFTSDYECDETHHWKTCKICHERFDYAEHVFNPLTNKCFICGYEDPLVHIDASGTMTGMTDYGKTKLTFNVPHTVNLINEYAFVGSQAVTVKINRECNGYHKDAFKGTNVKIITTEEPEVRWIYNEGTGYFEKDRVFDESEARVGNTYYKTLKEAIESTTIGDITVTLLRENIEETDPEPIKVTHSVTLVPYYSSCNLKCNFDISGAGIVYIPESVHYYDSTARLLMSDFEEERGNGETPKNKNTTDSVYSTGSLVFTHKTTAPEPYDNVKVSYVKSLQSGSYEWEAVGSHQVANTLLVLPVDHYAYGTFRFSKDFKEIKGLTLYGQTVSELHVTNVVRGVDAVIGQNAFTIAMDIYLDIQIKDIHFWFFRPKGLFFNVCIDNGITVVKKYAFSNFIGGEGLDEELERYLPIIFSHLFSVKLGDSVTEIQEEAFYENVSLETVSGGASLKTIGPNTFRGSFALVSADFSNSTKLEKIDKNAFAYCKELTQVILPKGVWSNKGKTYFSYNFTPERIARALGHNSSSDEVWTRKDGKYQPIAYTNSTSTDEFGWFNDVVYTNDIGTALNGCADGGEIYLSEDFDVGPDGYQFDLSKIKKWTSGTNGITLNADKALNNVTVKANDSSNVLSIPEGRYLALSNVKPTSSKIVLHTLASNDNTEYKKSGGFALEGLDPATTEDVEKQIYIDHNGTSVKATASVASIRDTNYDAFGLFDFILNTTADKAITNIYDISRLGRVASSIIVDQQIQTDSNLTSEINLDHDGQALADPRNTVSIKLADNVKSIGKNFFNGFKKLTQITAGEGLESIGANAFDSNSALSQINLNQNLKSIGTSAFNKCSALWFVNLPDDNNLESIGANAFKDCSNLRYFHFGNNINYWKATKDQTTYELDPASLADDTIAALFLIQDSNPQTETEGYMSMVWTRVPPNNY